MVRVLICDDAVAFATLVRHWLSQCDEIEVAGVAASGAEALEMIAEAAPDVIVLDHLLYDVPGGSEDLAPRLREQRESLGIVLVSGMPVADLATVAARAGADRYISKASTPEQLCEAVLAAAADRGLRPAASLGS